MKLPLNSASCLPGPSGNQLEKVHGKSEERYSKRASDGLRLQREGRSSARCTDCGIGTNNLFTLEAKYIPTNTVSSSRLIDVLAWCGTTNELFFGFMGCTSTNATLSVENIRFYSLAPPKLAISVTGSVTVLSWPIAAGGYAVESTRSLDSPNWEAATNPPAITADRYVFTNSLSHQARFFRLRQR